MKASTILLLATGIAIYSCGEKHNNKPLTSTNSVPQAFTDSKSNLKSYSRSSHNLVYELYTELTEQDPALKQLEEDLSSYRSQPNEFIQQFEHHNDKSFDYYTSAQQSTNMISDSILKKKLTNLITLSNERYLQSIQPANELITQIAENNISLNDHHIALKIALTLALTEKYKAQNPTDHKPFKALIKEQEKLLKQIDKQTPAF